MNTVQVRTRSSRVSLGSIPWIRDFLRARRAQRRVVFPVFLRIDVPPGIEELLVGRGDGAEFRLVAAGADQRIDW